MIPIYDRTILGNYGLESIYHHLVSNSNDAKDNTIDKIKAICHQFKYDFASALQIRKCNSKQLLFCAACDLQNRKLLNYYNFDTHLKEVMEGIKQEKKCLGMNVKMLGSKCCSWRRRQLRTLKLH